MSLVLLTSSWNKVEFLMEGRLFPWRRGFYISRLLRLVGEPGCLLGP